MTVTEFLRELKKERLTGREFLALIGNTEISNDDYTEIKDNPMMTYSRLVQILENSPITESEYENLLNTARKRRERTTKRKNSKQIKGENSSLRLEDIHAKSLENTADEITLDKVVNETPSLSTYNTATVEDLWGDDNEENIYESDPDFLEEFEEYGGVEDFDNDAERENRSKIIICLTLGIIIIALSFIIRFLLTGSFQLSEIEFKPPNNYTEMLSLFKDSVSRPLKIATTPAPVYTDYSSTPSPLSGIAATDDYLFKKDKNNIYSIKIDSGKAEGGPVISLGKNITGIFEFKNKIYAICDNYADENPDTIDEDVTIFEIHLSDEGETVNEYTISGSFRRVMLNDSGFFVVTDFIPKTDNPQDESTFIPYYQQYSGDKNLIDIKDIRFLDNSPYSNITVIASFSCGGDITTLKLNAISGNNPDCIYLSEDNTTLIMSFPFDKESRILSFDILGGAIYNDPYTYKVAGQVKQGSINKTGDIVRIVSALENPLLYILNSDLTTISRIDSIKTSEGLSGVFFDKNSTYIMADEIYAINTSSPESPTFIDKINRLTPKSRLYNWEGDRLIAVNIYEDEGGNRNITVSMQNDGVIEKTHTLSLQDVLWEDYTKSAVEKFRESVCVNADAGIIVIPVTYFNSVSRVESFFVLNYSDDSGFSEIGRITEIGVNASYQAAIIKNGYIYTFFNNLVHCSASDATVISSYEIPVID